MLPKKIKKMLKQMYKAYSDMHTETEEINYVSEYSHSLKMQQN